MWAASGGARIAMRTIAGSTVKDRSENERCPLSKVGIFVWLRFRKLKVRMPAVWHNGSFLYIYTHCSQCGSPHMPMHFQRMFCWR